MARFERKNLVFCSAVSNENQNIGRLTLKARATYVIIAATENPYRGNFRIKLAIDKPLSLIDAFRSTSFLSADKMPVLPKLSE